MSAKGKPTSSGKLVLNFHVEGSVTSSNMSTVLLVSRVKITCTVTLFTPRNEVVPVNASVFPLGAGIGFVTVTERGPVRFRYDWIVLSKSGAGVRVALVTVAAEIETT